MQRVTIEVEVSDQEDCGNCEYARTKGETYCVLCLTLGETESGNARIFPSKEGRFRWMRCKACLKRWPLEAKAC